MRYDFIIEYKALDAKGNCLKQGKIKAKNKLSKFDAVAGFENHLKKKLEGFKKLEVIRAYQWNDITEIFGDFFNSMKL